MTEKIRSEIERVKRRIERMPRIWKFRGKRVVPVDEWKLEDWTTFPDQYHDGFGFWLKPPRDWWKDYKALLTKLEDPEYGVFLCTYCSIRHAEDARKRVNRSSWADRGGPEAKEEFYKTCEPYLVSEFRLQDAMEQTELLLYNEGAGANDRTCTIINYFKCPYGEERKDLTNEGYEAWKLWQVVEWYHTHWDPNHSTRPPETDRKYFHRNEPRILDVTNLDDIIKAIEDGRIEKIAEEKKQYHKEHPT